MKDKEPVENDRTMATTALNRISTMNFIPTFGYGHSLPYSQNQSYPDHTDWGPSPPNADELAAAYAITQLRSCSNVSVPASRIANTSYSRASMPALDEQNSRRDEDALGRLDQNVKTESKSRNRCGSNPNILSVVKTEPVDEIDAINCSSSNGKLNYVNGIEEKLSGVATEGGHYVRTCMQADGGRRCCSSLSKSTPDHLGPTVISSRMALPFTSSNGTKVGKVLISRDYVQDLIDSQKLHGSSPSQSRSGARSCDMPARISSPQRNTRNISPKTDRIMGSDAINNRFERYSERRSPLNSLEMVSPKRTQTSDVRSLQRFDSPTNMLRKKAQYNIDQARRRHLSDESGLVRHTKNEILKGIFGSLSAIEVYCKQLDKSSRSPLDDNAIDLSMRKQVTKRRLSDDDPASQIAIKQSISTHIDNETVRETPELAMAFNRCDLQSNNADTSCYKTTPQLRAGLKQSHSEPHLLCDLDTTRSNVVPGTSVPLYNRQTISQQKSDNNIKSEMFYLPSDSEELNLKDVKTSFDSFQQLSAIDDVVSSRKSRSPTFQLPDCQLPPKKRRMFGQCWDVEEIKQDKCENETNKVDKKLFAITPDTMEVASHDVAGVTDKHHVLSIIQSRDSLLSAIRPDEDGDLPLHIAVVQGMVAVVQRILTVMKKLEISVDSCNNLKQTALHLAVMTNQPEVLDLLLDAGASPHLVDRHGNGVIHLAVRHNSLDCLSSLLERCQNLKPSGLKTEQTSLDLNVRNFEGVTPLQMAVLCRQHDAVQQLIRHGADVNVQEGKNGRTALYFAAELGDMKSTRALLENGADCSLLSYSGCSPAQAASGLNHVDLLQLLESYGSLNR